MTSIITTLYADKLSTLHGDCVVMACDQGVVWCGSPGLSEDVGRKWIAKHYPHSSVECNPTHPVIQKTIADLQRYFTGENVNFSYPFLFLGTEFQKAVWEEISKIPYGQTRNYKQIAEAIGKPKAVRAVGAACKANPIIVLNPCHRIVGTNKKLTGYVGGLKVKEWLLALENNSPI